VNREIEVLRGLNHPNIIKVYDWFESRDKFYLAFELATGGELFDRICEKGRFTEKDAAHLVHTILSAVAYLHEHHVVHRDLKPENLLYKTPSLDSDLTICDFGIAKSMANDDEVLMTVCGSLGYAAPEVLLRKGHGKPVDVWSIGVIAYTLLCGYQPFRPEDRAKLLDDVAHARFEFHERYWQGISEDAKTFIKSLLNVNPHDRPTAAEALKHTWLSGETASDEDLLPMLTGADGSVFHARRTFKSAIEAVQAINKLKKVVAFGNHGEAEPAVSVEEDAQGG